MAKRSSIAAGLLGQFCGNLRSAGFTDDDLISALKIAAMSLEKLQSHGVGDIMSDLEAMMNKAGFTKVDEGTLKYDDPSVGCSCPDCTARRARGAKHQDERNDV